MTLVSGIRSGLRSGIRSGLNPSDGDPGVTWTVDADSSVAMPVNATEYGDWLTSTGQSIAVPGSLFRCNEGSGNLLDSIGARVFTKAGASGTYGVDVAGWAVNGVQVPNNSGADYWSFAGVNLSTTAAAMFEIVDLRTLATSRMLFSLGGAAALSATEVYINATGTITAKRGVEVATSTAYPDDVVGILAVCRPGSSDFSVYVKKIGGALETLTPVWAAPPNAVQTVYLSSGWTASASDAVHMRIEYWTGTDAQIDATQAAAFFTARGF